MENLLQLIMFTALVVGVITAVFFGYIRTIPGMSNGIGWWVVGLAASTLGNGMQALPPIFVFNTSINELIYAYIESFTLICLFFGVSSFFDKNINKTSYWALYAALCIVMSYFLIIIDDFFWYMAVFSLFNGIISLLIAVQFLSTANQDFKNHYKILGLSFMVVGLHWFDAPFLRQAEWFLPIGFLIAVLTFVVFTVTYASLVLHRIIARVLSAEKKALNLAHHDALTGLENKRSLENKYETFEAAASRNKRVMAIFFIDLDQFKLINDTYGHDVGDEILINVAQRLNHLVRKSDVVARIGGDEFVVLASEIDDADAARCMGEHILKALKKSIKINGVTHIVNSSIGISLYPENGHKLADLIRWADRAMYEIKNSGRDNIRLYEC